MANNTSFAKEVTKIVVVQGAASAAVTAGMIVGLAAAGAVIQKFSKKK